MNKDSPFVHVPFSMDTSPLVPHFPRSVRTELQINQSYTEYPIHSIDRMRYSVPFFSTKLSVSFLRLRLFRIAKWQILCDSDDNNDRAGIRIFKESRGFA